MIPKRPYKSEENVDAWLMSYADMITLLLCFFIIFVSVSEPKKDKITEIAEGVKGKFGAVEYEVPFVGAVRTLRTVVEKNELYRDVAIENTSTSLSIELATHRFFKSGSADIDPDALPLLEQLMHALKQETVLKYTVVIESHTDDAPPQSGLYKDNWELSTLRAGKLARYLVLQGFEPNRLKAVGYADARPEVPNMDEKGRAIEANRARNQRVTIRLEQ